MPDEITPLASGEEQDIGAKVAKAVESLTAKHGSLEAALRDLIQQNYTLRDKNRDLSAKLPEGALVLKDDDARLFGQYRELGDPKELRKRLAEGDTSRANEARLLKEGRDAEAAELHGYRPAVLKTLARDLDIQFRDVKADGKTTRAAHVSEADEKGEAKLTPLPEYAEAHWKDFLPALMGSNFEPERPRGTPLPGRGNGPPPRPGAGTEDAVYDEVMRTGQYQAM